MMPQVNDAWHAMLKSRGAIEPFHRGDAWFKLLRGLGHTGTIEDMELQFWCAGGVIGEITVPFNVITTDGGIPLTTNDGLEYITTE